MEHVRGAGDREALGFIKKAGLAVFGLGRHAEFRRALPDAELFEQRRVWGMKWGDFIKAGVDPPEAQRLTNLALGFPPDFSPGQLA